MSKHVPNKQDNFYQGYYKPVNIQKYTGDPTQIIYRSSWEKKFMVYCDLNDSIIKWESEPVRISYVDFFGKKRYYIPDFVIVCKNPNDDNLYNKFLVEIKPEKETIEPIIPQGYISPKKLKNIEYEYKVYIKNKHKWAYAKDWCIKNDYEFKIVTERHLNKLGYDVR